MSVDGLVVATVVLYYAVLVVPSRRGAISETTVLPGTRSTIDTRWDYL